MKKKNLFYVLFIVIVASVAMTGCDKDKEKSLIEENGLSRNINDFISEDVLDILDSLEMPIYTGENPPNLEGKYLVSPYVLFSSNLEDDEIGSTYSDLTLSLKEQKNEELTVILNVAQSNSEGTTLGGYIVGDGDRFSAFAKIVMHSGDQDSCLMTRIFSGVITKEGIKDYYSCLVMLDDFGDPNDVYIENGATRIFNDEDGIAERQEETKSVSIKKNTNPILPGKLSDSE